MEIWDKLYQAALKVQNERVISPFISAGQVSAAILTDKENIYTGVCVDMACGLGLCAERNAILNMITNGESKIVKLLCIMPDGSVGSPCGACREFLMQLDKNSKDIEILTNYATKETITLGQLVPDWWGYDHFL
jgi:cytidine deaminase